MNIIEATKANFKMFIKWVAPEMQLSKHHLEMIDALQKCGERRNKRLIIVCPPQKGKSTMTSILFPCWLLAQNPNEKIVTVSYSQELSYKFTRQAREYIQSERFKSLTGFTKFKKDLNRSDFFSLDNGGDNYYKSTSIGATLTGYGCSVLILDDPYSNFTEAGSKLVRDRIETWFNSVALTRLEPKQGIVIISSTRWHSEDLMGTLMAKSNDYEVVHLKAISDEGEPLWAERYSIEDYQKIKEEQGSAIFEAMYQGNPRELQDVNIQISNFKYIQEEEMPNIEWARAWDVAVQVKSHSDFSASCLIGCDKYNNIYIKDVQKYKINYEELVTRIEEQAYFDGLDTHVIVESTGVGHGVFSEIKKRLEGFIVRDADNKTKNKIQKILPFVARVEAGKCYILAGQSWIKYILEEAETFPYSRHDDVLDAISIGMSYVSKRGTTYDDPDLYEPGTWGYFEMLSENSRKSMQQRRNKFRRLI